MKVILVDALHTLVLEGHGVFEDMHKLLEQYPNKKIILTGANDEQFKRFGLDKVPYKVFTLKHDPEKSDPRYYEIMLKQCGLHKENVLYFEHNADAVKSAQSVGITTYHYDKERKDLKQLKEFLDAHL
jgi:HAD superfamily hydrolase (TIGR01509 family)